MKKEKCTFCEGTGVEVFVGVKKTLKIIKCQFCDGKGVRKKRWKYKKK